MAVDLRSRAAGADGALASLAGLVDALGTGGFSGALMDVAQQIAGADHCSVFRFGADGPHCLGAASRGAQPTARIAAEKYVRGHWRHDPLHGEYAARLGRRGAGLCRIHPSDIINHQYRQDCFAKPRVVDKVALVRDLDGQRYCVTFYRSDASGRFDDRAVAVLDGAKELLLAAVAKHAALARPDPADLAGRPTADEVTDLVVQLHGGLTGREVAVLTRILIGMTSEGVALDLGIKVSSVVTYRKRAYAKLGISSQSELFARCLAVREAGGGQAARSLTVRAG
jgi:DNA-binding CsgD family transcriptional regulator